MPKLGFEVTPSRSDILTQNHICNTVSQWPLNLGENLIFKGQQQRKHILNVLVRTDVGRKQEQEGFKNPRCMFLKENIHKPHGHQKKIKSSSMESRARKLVIFHRGQQVQAPLQNKGLERLWEVMSADCSFKSSSKERHQSPQQ